MSCKLHNWTCVSDLTHVRAMWSPEVQFVTHPATRGMVQDTMPEEHRHCQTQRRRAADQTPVFDALGARTGCVRRELWSPTRKSNPCIHPRYIKATLLPALALNIGFAHKWCSVESLNMDIIRQDAWFVLQGALFMSSVELNYTTWCIKCTEDDSSLRLTSSVNNSTLC